jgi:hypothetical protein
MTVVCRALINKFDDSCVQSIYIETDVSQCSGCVISDCFDQLMKIYEREISSWECWHGECIITHMHMYTLNTHVLQQMFILPKLSMHDGIKHNNLWLLQSRVLKQNITCKSPCHIKFIDDITVNITWQYFTLYVLVHMPCKHLGFNKTCLSSLKFCVFAYSL